MMVEQEWKLKSKHKDVEGYNGRAVLWNATALYTGKSSFVFNSSVYFMERYLITDAHNTAV